MSAQTLVALIKDTFSEWSEDNAPRMAGALAFSTIFALAPLLVVIIAVAGRIFGQAALQGQITAQIEGLVGSEAARAIQDLLEHVSRPDSSAFAIAIGIATFLLGAWWVFGELQDALNTIWEVKPAPGRGWLIRIRDRLLSFTMMMGINFLLLVSLLVSAGLTALGAFLGTLLPDSETVLQILNFLISLGVIALLFAMMYKIIPDVNLTWGDVWIGAAVTGLLFSIGKFVIGLYLGTSTLASAYGAAGSLVIILVWVYYSAQILFFGAEFTKVYTKRYGTQVVPAEYAVPVTEEARAQQGIVRQERIEAAIQAEQREGQTEGPAHRPKYGRYAAAVIGFIAGIVASAVYGSRG